jgi:hypothetical protein
MTARSIRPPRRAVTFVLAAALCAATTTTSTTAAAAASDYFLKLPGVAGAAEPGPIPVQSFSWGATQHSSGHTSGGMGAGKANVQDISVMRGPRQTTAMDGTRVAAGDVDADGVADTADDNVQSPRDSASGMASGKRTHPALIKITKPLETGTIILKAAIPGCAVGIRYPSAEVGTPDARYALTDVTVAACGEEVALDYAKVKVRAWDAEKKEE